jgi:hypothetical protein
MPQPPAPRRAPQNIPLSRVRSAAYHAPLHADPLTGSTGPPGAPAGRAGVNRVRPVTG